MSKFSCWVCASVSARLRSKAPITHPSYSGILNWAIPLLASSKIQQVFLSACLPYCSGKQCFLLKRAEESPVSNCLVVSLVRMWIQFPSLLGGIQTHFPRHLPHFEMRILTTGQLHKRNRSQIPLALKGIAQVLLYYKGEERGLEYLPLKKCPSQLIPHGKRNEPPALSKEPGEGYGWRHTLLLSSGCFKQLPPSMLPFLAAILRLLAQGCGSH